MVQASMALQIRRGIRLVKRSLGFALLLTVFAMGCAHDPNRVSSLESSPTQLSQIPTNAEQVSPNPPGTKVVSSSEKSSAKKETPTAPANTGEDKRDYGDYKETDEDGAAGKESPANAEEKEGDAAPISIADPIEPVNRAMYTFNDKLYFWVLKPVAQGYNVVVPEGVRISVRNFFSNLGFPARFVNCLLLADIKCTGTELGRFVINTTMGIGGFFDPASLPEINLQKQDVDFGQTLGVYGVGHGFYIMWPVLGPSSPRDTVTIVGDYFLYPVSYITPWYAWLAVRSYQEVNNTSLSIGDYESLKEAAIDPYVSIRDAYIQHRQNKINERKGPAKVPQQSGGNAVEPITP
jgi:phospholipid-binding lipoprotein MlaA